MKILRLLNSKNFSIILVLLFTAITHAEDKPVDIWKIDNEKIENSSVDSESKTSENDQNNEVGIFDMQSKKKKDSIKLEDNLSENKIKIFGLYDPDDYGLDIHMWTNSDGDQLKRILKKIIGLDLSKDASKLMNISMLTNAYMPTKNISEKDFLKFKTDWLIKNSDLELIEEYIIKNQILNIQPELTRYIVDKYLSESNIEKACEIFSKNLEPIEDEYLSKFNIYCLIKLKRKEDAQLIFDLKKEAGFKDKYFEKKVNYLLGYSEEIDESISEKNILDFHLAHQTNPNFNFEPNENTKKIIWKYLSSSNLLKSLEKIETSEYEKISILEKATHDKNYPEKELFEIYKRFQFNINQLLDAEKSYKSLTSLEARALVYQKVLLESEKIEKLKLLKLLKELFEKGDIKNAFDTELKVFLNKIDPTDVPDTLTSFYYTNINIKQDINDKIKFNNDVLHQSKLINYFNGDYSKSKIEKDLDNFLKKIKKNKKYFFSKKDQIFLESLRFDGIEISKKHDDLFQDYRSEIPTDIQVMINNNEKGTALLRIVEIIGQDNLERIDEDTIYFIISTLNQLNISILRNHILMKVLPLKV